MDGELLSKGPDAGDSDSEIVATKSVDIARADANELQTKQPKALLLKWV